MPIRTLLTIWTVLVFTAITTNSKQLGDDPGLPDSVIVDSVVAYTNGLGIVPINIVNDEHLAGIEVTLIWDSPDIVMDSFSFVGSRVEYVSLKGISSDDTTITIYCFPFSGESLLLPGRGLFGQLYFSYPPTIDPQVVTIDSITMITGDIEYSTTFSDSNANAFKPQFEKGYLDIKQSTSCCIGNRGNVDAMTGPGGEIDVADLTYLVVYLFQGGPAPPCEDEGNVDGLVGPGGSIDVADLTYLVTYLFQGGDPPPLCPP